VNQNQQIRASSEQGEVSGELRLDMDRTKQTLRLINHQVKDGELLKGLGDELYQALSPNEINARFQAAIAGAQANNHSVRLRLIFASPELAALPWEFLYDKQTNTFLGNNEAIHHFVGRKISLQSSYVSSCNYRLNAAPTLCLNGWGCLSCEE